MSNLDHDQHAMNRVLKARAELILARRFYGVLVSNVEPVLSRAVPTMATDGRRHFANPEFVLSLSQAELLGVQAHETEHDARHHGTRRGTRDQDRWNRACDYAINPDLLAEGFTLPKVRLFEERFRGMSAEDIYRTMELDEQRAQPQPPPEAEEHPEDEPLSGQDEDDEKDNGRDEGDQGEPEPDDPEGDGAGGGPEQEPDGEDGQDASGTPQDGEGEGASGEGQDVPGEVQDGDGASGEGDSAGEGQGAPQGSSGDPGGCGEVLDAASDAGDVAELDQRWERITRQAAAMAKAVGQLPGHVSRDIERANNPGQDWREVLRAWFDQGSLHVETWNRPNRRFVGSGLYLPGNQQDGLNRVAMLIDTSGSMDVIALGLIRNETQAALDDGAIDEVVCVYGDTRVTRVDTWRIGDEIEFDPRGGGGTELKPLFDHVETLGDVSLAVCFTDGYIPDPGPQPAVPVLWAYTGYPQEVRRMIESAPWGAPGIDVGAH